MAQAQEWYIVWKDKEWLMSSRPDLFCLPKAHIFSRNVWDAKKFEKRADAKRKAKMIGGKVYLFNPATGKKEECVVILPAGAKCDTCRTYTPYNGMCRNTESENYKTTVSINDVCDEWEVKNSGRQGQENRAADERPGQVEKPRGRGRK